MKKTVYTIAFIALFSVMSNAQTTNKSAKQQPAKAQSVNPDGTAAPAEVATPAPSDNVKQQDSKNEVKPASGTRMAITEKGVPTSKKAPESKPADSKKTEAPKSEKH